MNTDEHRLRRRRIPSVTFYLCLSAFICGSSFLLAAEDIEGIYQPTPVDRSVERALDYLAKQQTPEGYWPSGFGPNSGITSLAILAFMAHGEVPDRGPRREIIQKGIDYVLQHVRDTDGFVVDPPAQGRMYEHGISAIMLTEALGMTPSEPLRAKLKSAIELILRAQRVQKDQNNAGGWRYQPNSGDSDISCTVWQLVALRASKNAGIDLPKESIDKAIAYVARCAMPDGGFAYQPGGGSNAPRTGSGMLSLQLCGDYNNPLIGKGAEYLKQHPPTWGGDHFSYAIYYCSNAMFQVGGAAWDFWRPKIEELLLAHQKEDGSWDTAPGSGHDQTAGPVYRTAMACLALCIEYRYLPIYQR